jgi:hypothetical protein
LYAEWGVAGDHLLDSGNDGRINDHRACLDYLRCCDDDYWNNRL